MLYKNIIKRLIDFVAAAIGLIIAFPVMVLIYILLRIVHNEAPFFYQKRAGKYGKEFKIIKFKTMNSLKDANGMLLPDADRITKLGGFLRKTSLDEIPQLINVIKGDMSLIGPRPLYMKYLPYYTAKEQVRHTVKPGITGLAQISGRNLIGWDMRLKKDIEYVENLSLSLDIKILLKTIQKVILIKDVAIDEVSGIFDLDDERKNKTIKIN
ncbi:sugar transferase [Mariniflexile jejuense]|uniref:Sugar transferase n=1 Tax=Mariniflexile jejuense TaxID=1173582 RepID=A0ABW3JF00_9FLAO